MSAGSMREVMPLVAEFIDDMREAFGADEINAQIRRGMHNGEPTFYAKEAGQEVGTRRPERPGEVWVTPVVFPPVETMKLGRRRR